MARVTFGRLPAPGRAAEGRAEITQRATGGSSGALRVQVEPTSHQVGWKRRLRAETEAFESLRRL